MLLCQLFVLLLASLVTQLGLLQAQNPSTLSPTITRDPESGQFHRDNYQLFCEATGNPAPVYSWLRNGTVISSNQTTGTYTLPTNTFAENGYYLCHATNKWGTAVSRTALVQQAFLNQFTYTDLFSVSRKAGESVSLQCRDRPDSVPGKTFRWETNTYTTQVDPKNIDPGSRIQVDQNTGNLYFANLSPTNDSSPLRQYLCIADTSLSIAKGSRTNLTVVSQAQGAIIKFIDRAFRSPDYIAGPTGPDTITVMEGEQLSLRCFFYGYPTPVITWYRGTGLLPNDSISDFQTTYTIASVKMSDDQAQFTCKGRNDYESQQTFTLNVEAKPNFSDNSSIVPVDMNGTIGYSVTFWCNPFAKPGATVTWLANGRLIDTNARPPAKYSVSPDGHNLTISDLCLQCPNGTTDQMVVTCNASNIHGYELKQVYLNILQPTTVKDSPTNQDVPAGQTARFSCSADSDPSTPISFIWLFNNTVINYQQNKIYATCTDSSCELTILKVGPSDAGIYTCRATNQFSENDSSAILIILPAAFTAATIWYVWLIIALLVVLLLLLLLCCWYCKDNGGDEYPVDEVEQKMGNDPEREIRDSRLLEFQLPPGTVINNNNYQLWTVAGSQTAGASKYGDGASLHAAPQLTIPPPPPVYTTSQPQLYPVAVYPDQVDAESYSTEAGTQPGVVVNYPVATGSRPLTPRSPTGYAYPAQGPAVMVPVHQNWQDEEPERDMGPHQHPGYSVQPPFNPRPGYAVVDPRDIDDVTPVPGGFVQLGPNYQAPHYYTEQVGGARVVAYPPPQHDWLQGPAGYEANYTDPGFNEQRYPQYNQRRAPSESSV